MKARSSDAAETTPCSWTARTSSVTKKGLPSASWAMERATEAGAAPSRSDRASASASTSVRRSTSICAAVSSPRAAAPALYSSRKNSLPEASSLR